MVALNSAKGTKKMKKRIFLCEGCRGNLTGDLKKSSSQLVQCKFADTDVEPVLYERGQYYENCTYRASPQGRALVELARIARNAGTCCPVRLAPAEKALGLGCK